MKRSSPLRRLYREFATYYAAERCPWAPANPRRVFNLAFKVMYHGYRQHLSPEQFLAVVCDTLGFREAEPAGLFQTFDPSKYQGLLAMENHFVNLFKRKLWGRLVAATTRSAQSCTSPTGPGGRTGRSAPCWAWTTRRCGAGTTKP